MRDIPLDKVFNMDCLDGLRELPDKCVDLVVTDPPYDLSPTFNMKGLGSGKRWEERMKISTKTINYPVLDELMRIMKKPNIYIWCNCKQVKDYLNYFTDKGCNYDILTWHKSNPPPFFGSTYLLDTEYCLFFKKKAQMFGTYDTLKKYWVTNTDGDIHNYYDHPTIKPLNIIKTLITNSSKEEDVVIDPFMGSGTTAVACKSLKRHFIGYEIDKKYFNICQSRIANCCTARKWYFG